MADISSKPCIVVIHYRPLQETTPVMTLLLKLKQFGYPVFYFSVESKSAREFLEKNCISFELLPRDESCYRMTHGLDKLRSRVKRGLGFLARRRRLLSILRSLSNQYDGNLIVWSQEFSGFGLTGNGILEFPRRIVTMFEMFEPNSRRWLGVDYERIMKTSTVVLPESNRAWILKAHLGLEQQPFVLENKLEPHPRTRNMPLPECAREAFERIGDRPVFLFQGSWGADRKDIGMVLETIARNRPNYCVVTMPVSDAARARLSAYPNAFMLPFIPAPDHFAVTSHATVGLAFYSDNGSAPLQRLNAIYCAPTKIYEYAGFGVPTLGNRLPGLIETIERHKAGICCDVTEDSILEAADRLVSGIGDYSRNATSFFETTNIDRQINDILDHVKRIAT